MKRQRQLIVLLVALAGMPLTCSAGVYKWVDNEGNVHFGDKPPVEAGANEVEIKINSYTSPGVTTSPFAGSPDNATASSQVILYSTSWCGYCKKARRYLKANNIPFTEYDVENSHKGRRDYKAMGGTSVPIILVGNKRLNGFSPDAFEQIYD